MEAERDVELLLSLLAEDTKLSILPRICQALALIERSPAFEGDGDLAAALMLLHEVVRDLSELDEGLPVYGGDLRLGD
jgi:hypothetical protein